jgi:ketosteroid isomerase-like protein
MNQGSVFRFSHGFPVEAHHLEPLEEGGDKRGAGVPLCGACHPTGLPTARRSGDTARAMSQENVEAFKRGLEAGNRGDVETLLEELDPEVEWHSALHALLGGEQTVFRGHDGVREMLRDLNEAFGEIHIEISEIRDLGDRLVAIGRNRARGRGSGAETETPLALVTEVKNGKTISVRGYLDPKQALEAAGLSE